MGRILAIDYGKKRTGLAVTDILRITANPLITIETKHLMTWLKDYFAKENVDEVVVGYPKQMNGEDSESMQYIRVFLAQFEQTFPSIPIKLYDERFTSVLAHQAMIDGGMKRSQRQNKMMAGCRPSNTRQSAAVNLCFLTSPSVTLRLYGL